MTSEKHSSVVLKIRSEKALNEKLALLKHWIKVGLPWNSRDDGSLIRDETGEKELIDYPKDIRSFAAWAGRYKLENDSTSMNVELIALGRTTLYQSHYREVLKEATALMGLVEERARQQLAFSNKSSIIDDLKAQLAIERKICAQQEIDVIRLRRDADAARVSFANERALRLRNEEELNRKNAELEAKISVLTESMVKLVPLRASRR